MPVVAPFGWFLILSAGIGLIAATWLLYGGDAAGMWAGYHDGMIGTAAVLAAMALRTSLPQAPALGLVALCGIVLILLAVFRDNQTAIFVSELVAGIGLIVGAGLYASGRHD